MYEDYADPNEDVRGPFQILTISHRDVQIQNWLPGVLYQGVGQKCIRQLQGRQGWYEL